MPDARKKNKLKKSRTGGQFFQSERQAEKRMNVESGRTELEKKIEKMLTEKMISGEISPEESGRLKAKIFADSVEDAVNRSTAKYIHGGAVMKGRGGKFKGTN
jgi:hypothetical protein